MKNLKEIREVEHRVFTERLDTCESSVSDNQFPSIQCQQDVEYHESVLSQFIQRKNRHRRALGAV